MSDTSVNNQTSYKNLEGTYVTGELSVLTVSYGTEIFNVLNGALHRQSLLSDVISLLPKLKADNLQQEVEDTRKTLDKDIGFIQSLDIPKIPETAALEDMKLHVSNLLSKNKADYAEFLLNHGVQQIELEMDTITKSLDIVSGKNIHNFNIYYKNSDEFSSLVITHIKNIKQKITHIQKNEKNVSQIESLLDRLNVLKNKALDTYNMALNVETLNKKAHASGTNMKDLFEQIFPGSTTRPRNT